MISGLPTQSLIDQLISLEARPLTLYQQRIETLQAQRTAYGEVTARLLGLKGVISRFDDPAFFNAFSAQSGNESVLTATAGERAITGTFQFQVRSLVTNQQLIGGGFTDADSQPVGAGTLTFEMGNGRLDTDTRLEALNGGTGVRRGKIEIVDGEGDRATVDLTTAITVNDVLDAINNRTDINVTASVDGDRLVIEDDGGGAILVADLNGGQAAADLGIAGSNVAGTGRIVGQRIIFLSDRSPLSILNDGNGVSVGKLNQDIEFTVGDQTFTAGMRGLLKRTTYFEQLNSGNGVRTGTFRITNRAGASAEIVIDESIKTIGNLIDAVEDAGIDVSLSLGAADGRLLISDSSTPSEGETAGQLVVEDVSGFAAADLGIIADTDTATFSGNVVNRVNTLGDVLRAINFAVDDSDPANIVLNEDIVASIGASGRGIQLVSQSGVDFTVEAGESGSFAAEQLGLLGESANGTLAARDVLADLNSVLLSSLRGGSGVQLGEVKFTDASGASVELDLSVGQPSSVQQLIDRLNADLSSAGVGITASLNSARNGISFEDTSGGPGPTRILDTGSTGTLVADLFGAAGGIIQSTTGELNTGNAQLQYVSRTTRLETLGAGRGVAQGQFTIRSAAGGTVTVTLGANQKTIGDTLDFINALSDSIGVEARINANGDGIELIDRSGSDGTLTVTDVGASTTARDLNLAGDGTESQVDGETVQSIDGSFEYSVDVDGDDTLNDVQTKINELGLDVSASVINDGGLAPYRLIVTSNVSGTCGALTLDAGTTGLSFDTLVRAQDAVVFFGGAGADSPIVLTSSTNTLSNVLPDVTINLTGTSDQPVELNISQDIDQIVTDIETFVSTYNGVLDAIGEHTKFDAETNERGLLFGENSINTVRNRLRSSITRKSAGAPPGFDRLIFVGVRTGSGGRLTFDAERFRELYSENPESIETLFTQEETGFGDAFDKVLDDLTRDIDGLLSRRDDVLSDREDILNDRITNLQDLLARKRQRLERQFQGLETSLSGLQGAQNSLSALVGLTGGG